MQIKSLTTDYSTMIFMGDPELAARIADSASTIGINAIDACCESRFKALYKPDLQLILLDVYMPNFDGVEAIKHLAAVGATAKIVLMCDIAEEMLKVAANLAQGYGLEVVAMLPKPICTVRLIDYLQSILGTLNSSTADPD